jgi:hypothetical protein
MAAADALALVPVPAPSNRRPYQDYSSWAAFGTKAFWCDVFENPGLALELIAQRFSLGGLFMPSEACSADFAAGAAVATHGPSVAVLPDDVLQDMFTTFKVRLHA